MIVGPGFQPTIVLEDPVVKGYLAVIGLGEFEDASVSL